MNDLDDNVLIDIKKFASSQMEDRVLKRDLEVVNAEDYIPSAGNSNLILTAGTPNYFYPQYYDSEPIEGDFIG